MFGREPVMWMAVIQAGVALGVSFGLGWTAEQVGAVTAFSAAVLGLIARQTVTPNQDVALRVDGKKVSAVLLAAALGGGLLMPACAGKSAPVLVGQTGLAIAEGIGQLQSATKQLTEAGVVPTTTALTIQEALLSANGRLKPLPPLLRAIDAAQQANDQTAPLVDQALVLVQHVADDLDLVINRMPVSDAAKQLLALAQATRQTITTLLVNLARLRAQE